MRQYEPLYVVAVLIHTYKRGEVSNPLVVSLEAQCLSPNPLSPRLGLVSSRFTFREAKGGRPYLLMAEVSSDTLLLIGKEITYENLQEFTPEQLNTLAMSYI
jgi:hypothetical protein